MTIGPMRPIGPYHVSRITYHSLLHLVVDRSDISRKALLVTIELRVLFELHLFDGLVASHALIDRLLHSGAKIDQVLPESLQIGDCADVSVTRNELASGIDSRDDRIDRFSPLSRRASVCAIDKRNYLVEVQVRPCARFWFEESK